jgi:hypothetical protein
MDIWLRFQWENCLTWHKWKDKKRENTFKRLPGFQYPLSYNNKISFLYIWILIQLKWCGQKIKTEVHQKMLRGTQIWTDCKNCCRKAHIWNRLGKMLQACEEAVVGDRWTNGSQDGAVNNWFRAERRRNFRDRSRHRNHFTKWIIHE